MKLSNKLFAQKLDNKGMNQVSGGSSIPNNGGNRPLTPEELEKLKNSGWIGSGPGGQDHNPF